MASAAVQYVDPVVSQTKFDREIAQYLECEAEYRSRGWFLVTAEWPLATVLLASKRTSPPVVVTAVQFDYSNYDAEPPSVRLIDPFSGRTLLSKEIPLRLNRKVLGPEMEMPDGTRVRAHRVEELMQAHSPEDLPFLCIPGVKEYHDHPGHTGDPWEMHRPAGSGRMVRLLEVISRYSLEAVTGLQVDLVPQVSFAFSEPPE